MKEKTTKKRRGFSKLIPAACMLLISATTLVSSTYAWFTMNKEVSVTGMEVKAHAEEGLLINEVKLISSNTWDEAATANTTPSTVVLRPASTSDMVTFWHANSKKSNIEAGVDNLTDTVKDASNNYYQNVTAGQTGIEDEVLVYDESQTTQTNYATGNSKAETHIYYRDASFGDAAKTAYNDGEGFYVKYTYYLKSSGDADLNLDNLEAQVKATKKTTAPAGTSTDLEKSLRVGIAVPASNTSATINGYKIFAPVAGANASYSVTGSADGAAETRATVAPTVAATTGSFTDYVRLNNSDGAATPTYSTITIPNVNNTNDGLPVYVYVWFEGEDTNCKSDNITAALSTYDIDIQFRDAAIY